MPTYGFTGIPPSRLGMVCKPDMPPHINILFRARPPVEFVPRETKPRTRPYEGITFSENILDHFEKTDPPKYTPIEDKRVKKLKTIVTNIEKNKQDLANKECKYLNINIFR
jgi:hypothetical protein